MKVSVPSEEGRLTIDAIEYNGGVWLVPQWLDHPFQPARKPVRIIRLDLLPHSGRSGPWDYVLTGPVPRDVLEGKTKVVGKQRFVVIERPDIEIQTDDPYYPNSLGERSP
jgi:hypothetical protein